jgi:hypothetical protein
MPSFYNVRAFRFFVESECYDAIIFWTPTFSFLVFIEMVVVFWNFCQKKIDVVCLFHLNICDVFVLCRCEWWFITLSMLFDCAWWCSSLCYNYCFIVGPFFSCDQVGVICVSLHYLWCCFIALFQRVVIAIISLIAKSIFSFML